MTARTHIARSTQHYYTRCGRQTVKMQRVVYAIRLPDDSAITADARPLCKACVNANVKSTLPPLPNDSRSNDTAFAHEFLRKFLSGQLF